MTALASPELRQRLELANEVRVKRANLRGEVRSLPRVEGVALVADVIVECPAGVGGMRVDQLLCWPDGWGPQTALRVAGVLAVRAGASETRCLSELSVRQREVMAMVLRRYYA